MVGATISSGYLTIKGVGFYVLETDAGRLLELPTHWGVDDYPQYAHKPDLDYMMPVKAPSEAVRNYREEFEAHYACGGLWIPVWHPYLTGRLARWWHIEKMLEEIRARNVSTTLRQQLLDFKLDFLRLSLVG